MLVFKLAEGVEHRRWLVRANPGISNLMT